MVQGYSEHERDEKASQTDPEWLRFAPHARYVRHHLTPDWSRLGWIPQIGLCATPHGEWSVMMRGLDCECQKQPRYPQQNCSPQESFISTEQPTPPCPLWRAASIASQSYHTLNCSRFLKAV